MADRTSTAEPGPGRAGHLSPRAAAARVLSEVLRQRRHLDSVLDRHAQAAGESRDRALTRELCYGVMRWYWRLDFILGQLLQRPLKVRDTDIRALILAGLYQIEFLRIPDHAAISATVSAAGELQKQWASALVNAVLRRYQREAEKLKTLYQAHPAARYAHPEWFIEALRSDWPDRWQSVLEANNRRPPLHLRVNLGKTSRQNYLRRLQDQGLDARPSGLTPEGIHLTQPMDVTGLPGFAAGEVSVQDFGAQLAATLLQVRPGQRVLDACAAPGGKTGHLHESCPRAGELVALDTDRGRIKLLHQAQQRLGFNAKVIHSDIIRTDSWWDGNRFDRVLLDVPCSATGVIRRHPDIKYLRSPEQVGELGKIQLQIIEAVWPLLKAGGRLVYVTCSVLREEGDEQIEFFTGRHADAGVETIAADWGISTAAGRQLLPGGTEDTDGFYYAVLTKTG